MNPMRWRVMVGGLLVLAGVLAMVNAITGYNLGGIVWALLLGLGGLAFIFVMASNKSNWWAAIPGFTLLGIAALVGVGSSCSAGHRSVRRRPGSGRHRIGLPGGLSAQPGFLVGDHPHGRYVHAGGFDFGGRFHGRTRGRVLPGVGCHLWRGRVTARRQWETDELAIDPSGSPTVCGIVGWYGRK